ncbi:ACP S-malonyltransferase [Candidatus Microgenomates bacterium]|nr:ACP S-malonyltransferase [Candidatus Microgenomates bacterium]
MVEAATLTRPAPQTSSQSEEISAAIFFPGQGLPPGDICSYYELLTGLNPELTKQYLSLAQQALEKVQGSSTFNIETALQDETSEAFQKTSFVQPLVYTLSVLTYEIIRPRLGDRNIVPKVMAGHSLGEYSALTAAGVILVEKGVEIVSFRGMVMQQACDETPSKLISIRGWTEAEVRQQICSQSQAEIALINAPNLIVVGCSAEQVPTIEQLAKERGGQRITVLDTAGAFHTLFMQRAASELEQFLVKYSFANPDYPIVANLTGDISESGASLRNHLVEGMVNPVRWAGSLATIKEMVKIFVESGPGTSLTRLNVLNGIPEEQTVNINHFL